MRFRWSHLGRSLRALLTITRFSSTVVLTLAILVLRGFFSQQFVDKSTRRICRRVLRILRLEVDIKGDFPRSPTVVVSNHISWLDPLVLVSQIDLTVVAKAEVSTWPIIGWITRKSNVVFVDRNRARTLTHALPDLLQVLRSNRSVAFFPEGTTSQGDSVLPFRSSLFECAIASGSPIVPVALIYHGNDEPAHPYAFIGEHTFLQSLLKIARSGGGRVQLIILPRIDPSFSSNRSDLAAASYQRISSALQQNCSVIDTAL